VSGKLSATVKEAVADARVEIPQQEAQPKRVRALPDLEQAKAAVLNSLTSASGQRTYDHAIREFVAWYCSEPRLAFNRTAVLRYRIHLEQRQYASATINRRLAAVRRVAYEADAGLLSPELAAGIRRVKGVRRLGVRLGAWLTPEQGRRLLEAPNSRPAGTEESMTPGGCFNPPGATSRELFRFPRTTRDLGDPESHVNPAAAPRWVEYAAPGAPVRRTPARPRPP
jgi:hypothetical protein